MVVRISQHALERFRQRSKVARQDFEVSRLLKAIVMLSDTARQPGEWRLKNRGMVVVGETVGDIATVCSCWFLKSRGE